jgi:hypothetical protein
MNARCNGDTCAGVLKSQSNEEAMNCTKARVVEEPVDGCKSEFPSPLKRPNEHGLLTILKG